MAESVKEVHTVELRTREDFLKYSCQLTMDPDTMSQCLSLSEGNREVTRMGNTQYDEHPDRFDRTAAVLCKEGLSGCCYWEAEWSGPGRASIAVAYKEMDRKGGGPACSFGQNDKSWRLRCTSSSCSFWHNGEETTIPVSPSSKIGVYLDHKPGILSFYDVSDTMILLHRVQTKFAQALYPGFWLDPWCSVKLCDLE